MVVCSRCRLPTASDPPHPELWDCFTEALVTIERQKERIAKLERESKVLTDIIEEQGRRLLRRFSSITIRRMGEKESEPER